MLYTSAEANKLLKLLRDDLESLRLEEEQTCTFVAATVEHPEDVRPEYDFEEMQQKIEELEGKILKVKHAMNLFNTTHTLPGSKTTIDEALVRIPQLTAKKAKLSKMCKRQPKARKRPAYGEKTNYIEYEYANYDIAEARSMYASVSDELAFLQLGLDKVNTTEEMDITF